MSLQTIPLNKLFSDTIYEIPEYQRPYAWVEQQLRDLWEDLTDNEFLQFSNSKVLSANHYMGTVVVKKKGEIFESGENFVIYELIDGQQRLLTLVILIRAICEQLRLRGSGATDYATADNLYDKYIMRGNNQKLRKLILQGRDDSYLWDTVLNPQPLAKDPATPAQRRMRKAYEFFKEKLNGIGIDNIRALSNNIVTRLLFLKYDVQSELEAGLIFETINDRGKQLSQMDKIKAHFIYLGSKLNNNYFVDLVNRRWEKVLENIALAHEEKDDTQDEENRFIRYHWIMLTSEFRSYEIHREVKKKYNLKNTINLPELQEYVDSLEEVSETYRQIMKPLGPGFLDYWKSINVNDTEEIRAFLEDLHRIDTLANFIPLLFAARKSLSDPADFCKIARLCYLLGWRVYKVCNRRADTGLSVLSSLAHDLYKNGASELERVLNGIIGIINVYGDDKKFASDLRTNLSDLEKKYFLFKWEEHCASSQKTLAPNWDTISQSCEIEHIFPINSKYQWSSEQNKKRYEDIVGLIGNLVLAEQAFNRSMGNGFVHEKLGLKPPVPVDPKTGKKMIYPNSGLASQRQLANDQELKSIAQLEMKNAPDTEILDAIEKFVQRRTDELVDFALNRWVV